MLGNLFHGPAPWIVLFVVLLLFGAPKLPALAKSLGQSMKILKKEVSTKEDDQAPAAPVQSEPDSSAPTPEQELAQARAEAAAAKAEAEALRAAAEKRAQEAQGD